MLGLTCFTMTGEIEVDLLVHARWIVPIRPTPTAVLLNHSVAVRSGAIVDILPTTDATNKYNASTVLNRPNHVLMPGLINAHTHSGMSLMRGCSDDAPLHEWLQSLWPIEGEFCSADGFCYDGALLAAAEMIRGGVCTCNDGYWDMDATCRAVVRSGMRAVVGISIFGFRTDFGDDPDDYIKRGEDTRNAYQKESRLTFTYYPHAPYTVPDGAWEMITKRALESDTVIHTHIHETADEVNASVILDKSNPACHRSEHALRPLVNLERLGVLKAKVCAVHMVHLNDADIRICHDNDVCVVHCPTSNAKLAAGWCDTKALLEAGVTVALGTDSAVSNNSLDMFQEMKLAALFAKNLSGDASVLNATTALEMATINGAKALALDHKIGSLEPGKQADFITVELGTHVCNTPVSCVHSALVYATDRTDVCDVFVDGDCLMREKSLAKLNENDVCERAQAWANRIVEKFGPSSSIVS